MRSLGGEVSGGRGAPTAREIAIILFRHKRTFLVVYALVLVATLLYALIGTGYEAHMKVMVRRGRADPPVTAQKQAPLEFAKQEITEEEVNSYDIKFPEIDDWRPTRLAKSALDGGSCHVGDWIFPAGSCD